MRSCRSGRHEYRTAAAAVCQCGPGADKKKSMQQPITVGNGNCWLWLKQSRARVCRPSGLQSFRHRNGDHATLRNVPQRCILETPVWIFIPGAIRNSYVLDIHSHHPMMGYRQIRDKLRLEFGWIISDPTVWKSMKRLGIHGYTRHRKTPVTGSNLEHIRYSNVLNRKFKAE